MQDYDGRYTRIKHKFWRDERVQRWSDDARLLALYLLTSPHSNLLGCYVLPKLYACEDLGWEPSRFDRAFAQLLRDGFCEYDTQTKLVLITNFLRHNPLDISPNRIKAAINLVQDLPRSRLIAKLKALVEEMGKDCLQALVDALAQHIPQDNADANGEALQQATSEDNQDATLDGSWDAKHDAKEDGKPLGKEDAKGVAKDDAKDDAKAVGKGDGKGDGIAGYAYAYANANAHEEIYNPIASQSGTLRVPADQQSLAKPPGVEEKITNRDLIAELTAEYRSIEGVKPAKGDFAFIGALYNEYGYDRVLCALHKLRQALALEQLERPLVYLKGILRREDERGTDRRDTGKARDEPKQRDYRSGKYAKLFTTQDSGDGAGSDGGRDPPA